MTAGEIAERFPLANSTLSGHFAVLKAAGLIIGHRDGTRITYSLNVSLLEETLIALLQHYRLPAHEAENQPAHPSDIEFGDSTCPVT